MAEIIFERTNNHSLVKICGRIDGQSAPDIEEAFIKMTSEGERIITVDLSLVNYVSSAGLRVLLSTQKKLKQISGELLLLNPPEFVLEILNVSGFIAVFKVLKRLDESAGSSASAAADNPLKQIESDGIKAELLKYDNPPGKLLVYGSTNKLNDSDYGENDVLEVTASSVRYGTGLAAIGENYAEYQHLFGETLILNGNFFNYPAIKNPAVDFIFGELSADSMKYKFLHGFGLDGNYSAILSIDAEEKPAALIQLIELTNKISSANLYGIVLIMESAGILGMNLKKIPLSDNKPSEGSIFDHNNFADWVNFPLEPAHSNNIVAAAGLAVKDKSKLAHEKQALFSEGADCHIHAAVFEKGFVNMKHENFDAELNRIIKELDVIKIQHLLGKSHFKRGLIAIMELE